MVSPSSDRIPRAPPYSCTNLFSTCTGLSPSAARLPMRFQFLQISILAGPISLATTLGVSVDFLSCRYLDVSVPCVRPLWLSIHHKVQIALWVSPFGHPRINAYSQLPTAFRSVSRPSSPLIAKAFTKCPYLSLDSLRINYLHHTIMQILYISHQNLPAFNIFYHIKRCIFILFANVIISNYILSAFSLIHSFL